MQRIFLQSFNKSLNLRPKTRDEEFLTTLKLLRCKPRNSPKIWPREEEINKLFNFIISLQERLNLTNKEYANRLGITERMVTNYRNRSFPPHVKTFKKMLALERCLNSNIVIVKNKVSFITCQAIHTIYI